MRSDSESLGRECFCVNAEGVAAKRGFPREGPFGNAGALAAGTYPAVSDALCDIVLARTYGPSGMMPIAAPSGMFVKNAFSASGKV